MTATTRHREPSAAAQPLPQSGQEPTTDPPRPWRRLAAEVVGTYFLVTAAMGADVVADLHPGAVSSASRAVAPALVVAAMIYALGHVSGAHLNPAVTCAFATRGVFRWRHVPVYVAAQLLGAVIAAAVLHLTLQPIGHQGTTYPHGTLPQSLGMEVVLTMLLVFVILNAAHQHRLLGPNAALPVGATIAAAGLVGLAISGASMNPARSLGPALVAGIAHDQWIYVVGPLIGALLGVLITRICHGPPRDEEEEAAEGQKAAHWSHGT